MRLLALNSACRSSARSIGEPSPPAESGYLSISSQTSSRIGRMARLVGLLAPTRVMWPPGNCLCVRVAPESRDLASPNRSRSTRVSRIIGASRSFEKVSAASSFGNTPRIGHGSTWMKRPAMFSMQVVFSSCVQAISVILLTPGSVAHSIGPRATSTREAMNRPPFELSLLSRRYRSAHCTTSRSGGGVSPRRHALRRLAVSAELAGGGLTEFGEVLFDIGGQDRRQLPRFDLELVGHLDRDPGRPRQPGISERPAFLEERCLGRGPINELAAVPLDDLLPVEAEPVLFAPDRDRSRQVGVVGVEGIFLAAVAIKGRRTGLWLGSRLRRGRRCYRPWPSPGDG